MSHSRIFQQQLRTLTNLWKCHQMSPSTMHLRRSRWLMAAKLGMPMNRDPAELCAKRAIKLIILTMAKEITFIAVGVLASLDLTNPATHIMFKTKPTGITIWVMYMITRKNQSSFWFAEFISHQCPCSISSRRVWRNDVEVFFRWPISQRCALCPGSHVAKWRIVETVGCHGSFSCYCHLFCWQKHEKIFKIWSSLVSNIILQRLQFASFWNWPVRTFWGVDLSIRKEFYTMNITVGNDFIRYFCVKCKNSDFQVKKI